MFFYLIIACNSAQKWILGVVCIAIAFAYDMILGGRTFFALTGASFALSMLVFICGQEDTIKQLKAIAQFFYSQRL